ncbi:unnamed protein product [Thelazia callipaeda]|uniref:Uncharacterized protein n=1 Tax=Thelazia callipaeda TaxID=103827 RepID=A0A0N5D8V6_THECL|nr:unnamed protein product [Thelazia callipaeda]
MYYQSCFRIFLTVRYSDSVAVNSFNGLQVGSNQLNSISNGVPAVGIMNAPLGARPATIISAPVPHNLVPPSQGVQPVPVINSVPATLGNLPTGVRSNSFQGNIGGVGSFRNNAGVSLLPSNVPTNINANIAVLSLSVLINLTFLICMIF